MSSTNSISTENQAASLHASSEFNSSLGRALFQQKLEAILQGTLETTGADGVAVSLKHDDVYVCRASVGSAPDIGVTVEPGQGLCGRCVAEAKTIVEQELNGEIKSVVAVPVLKDGVVHGFIAGFSVNAGAFSVAALEDFRQLALLVHNEVDPPPVAFEINPEATEADDELLTQLGISLPSGKELASEEEDESFLTELVHDVLQQAPSSAPGLTNDSGEESHEETVDPPTAHSGRTTEEVLMEVVDHTAPSKPIAAPSTPPPESKASAPSATNLAKAESKQTPVPTRLTVTTPPAKAKPPAIETQGDKGPGAWLRPAILTLVLLALAAVATWYYFRIHKARAEGAPQKVLASAPEPVKAAEASATVPQRLSPDKPPEKKAATTTPQPKSRETTPKPHQRPPILVASSDNAIPRVTTTEEQPVALSGVGGKIAAPELPSTSSTVIFGGTRSAGAIPAKLIQRVDPNYPIVARSMHLSGEVRLEATVGTDGRVRSVKTLEGHQILVAAAIDAVRRWRYQPASQNGTNVESIVEVTIRFR